MSLSLVQRNPKFLDGPRHGSLRPAGLIDDVALQHLARASASATTAALIETDFTLDEEPDSFGDRLHSGVDDDDPGILSGRRALQLQTA